MNAYWLNLFITGGIAAIEAWALGLVVRSGQLSVGHAALAGIGGYAAGWFALHGYPTVVSFVAALIVAGVAGFSLSVLTLRLNHLFLALATLIFGQILVLVATGWGSMGGAAGLAGVKLLQMGPIVVVVAVAIILLELFVLRGSRLEMQSRVLATDSTLVELSGRSSRWMRVGVFTVSATVAGLGGAMSVFNLGVVQPNDLGFDQSLNLLVFVIVGGSTSGLGALVGGFVLSVLPDALDLQGVTVTLVLGAILLLVMLVRQDGLIPRIPVRVFRGSEPGPPTLQRIPQDEQARV